MCRHTQGARDACGSLEIYWLAQKRIIWAGCNCLEFIIDVIQLLPASQPHKRSTLHKGSLYIHKEYSTGIYITCTRHERRCRYPCENLNLIPQNCVSRDFFSTILFRTRRSFCVYLNLVCRVAQNVNFHHSLLFSYGTSLPVWLNFKSLAKSNRQTCGKNFFAYKIYIFLIAALLLRDSGERQLRRRGPTIYRSGKSVYIWRGSSALCAKVTTRGHVYFMWKFELETFAFASAMRRVLKSYHEKNIIF